MTTLQRVCDHPGVIAACCQYDGQPQSYRVNCAAPGVSEVNVKWYGRLLESALKMAQFIEKDNYRIVISGTITIVVLRHRNLEKCHIAAVYRTQSAAGKSIRRIIRAQFKNFTAYQIIAEPGKIYLGV